MRKKLVLLLFVLLGGCAREAPLPRHVFLLTVDTLRADHLGSYGHALGLTPNLDRLAERAERFTLAYATAPFTLPSIASLLGGRYPEELGIMGNIGRLRPEFPTLVERLGKKGFTSAAVVSNFVLRSRTGLNAGFAVYDERFPQREKIRGAPERIAEPTTDAAIAALDRLLEQGAEHIFLWVHYQDPHGPYTPPEGFRERYLPQELARQGGEVRLRLSPRGLGGIPDYQHLPSHRDVAFYRAGYDGEVSYMDREVGRLLHAIAERGLDREAMIIFTADHGEGLGEGGYWFAHGEYLNDPVVRVPLLIRTPGRPARERDDLVSLVDIAATLAKLFDLGPTDSLPGRDLFADTASGQAHGVHFMTTRSAATQARVGLVMGKYKYIRSEAPGGLREEVYRLPDEARNLADSLPDRVQGLRAALDSRQRATPALAATDEPGLSPSEVEALRALGYLRE
jgi:arylsulfatase